MVIIVDKFLDLNMSDAKGKVEGLYTSLLPALMDKTYTLIKFDSRSAVFSIDDLIVKAYPTIIMNSNEKREDDVCRDLYDRGLNVPQRFDIFKTEFYTCYTMEKLPLTLIALLEARDNGDIDLVCNIITTVIPILHVLHRDYRSLYVDFSVGNIAFKNDICYMLDFGSLYPDNFSYPPNAYTLRYCSVSVSPTSSAWSSTLASERE